MKSHEKVFNTLLAIAEERCHERDLKALGHKVPDHVQYPHNYVNVRKLINKKADCIQWVMETSPRKSPWSAKRVVHEVMAIWFGSVHAISTVSPYLSS